MIIKRLILLSTICFVFSSCRKDEGCIDENLKHHNPCIHIYDPVCGCNKKTYSNSCEAQRDGVTSWANGECK